MMKILSAYAGGEPFVFICYAHADGDDVFSEIRRLQESGFNVWYDEGITPGSEWSAAIASAIERCSVFLYLVSPYAVLSEHCRREVNFALDQDCTMQSLHIKNTDVPSALRLSLSHRQAILKHEDKRYEEKLDGVLRSILSTETTPVGPIKNTKPAIPWRWGVALFVTGLIAIGIWQFYRPHDLPIQNETQPQVKANLTDWLSRSYEADTNVVVLPFQDFTSDRRFEQLAASVTHEIRYQLSQEGSYNVAPSSLSNADTIPLDTNRVIEATIRQSGDQLVINFEVFDPLSEKRIFSDQDRWEIASDDELHPRISNYLASFLSAGMSRGEYGPSTPEAYRVFKQWMKKGAVNWDTTMDAMLEITRIEPTWIDGWAWLGDAWYQRAGWLGDSEFLEKANEAFQRGVEFGGDNTRLQGQLARHMLATGELIQGEEKLAESALEAKNPRFYAGLMLDAGLAAEAQVVFRKHMEVAPYWTPGWIPLALSCAALLDPECVIEAERMRESQMTTGSFMPDFTLFWAYARIKDKDRLRALLSGLDKQRAKVEEISTEGQKLNLLEKYGEARLAALTGERPPALIQWLIDNDWFWNLVELGYEKEARVALKNRITNPIHFTNWSGWGLTSVLVPENLRSHALNQEYAEALGYTPEFRLKVCRRVHDEFPEESGLKCNPSKYVTASLAKDG